MLLLDKKNNQSGFSLVEMVLYLAIVSILLVAVVDFNLTISGTASKLGANIKTSQNRRATLSVIDYLVRNSDGLLKDVNGFCLTSTTLALYFNDDTYLPGTCVENGGGVKITTVNNRVQMSCYPNITNNGQYGACASTVANTYYLSSPEISIASNNGLIFSTSTATSTFSGFMNINTFLTFTNISGGQTELEAVSTASSTITLRSSQADGLLAWWKFDDISDTSALDSKNSHDADCRDVVSQTTPLVRGSNFSFDFERDNNASCYNTDSDFNISGPFTISAWIHPESLSTDSSNDFIINKQNTASYLGYAMWVKDERFYCGICDGSVCVEDYEQGGRVYVGETYHLICSYDPSLDQMKLYNFQEGVGNLGTTTIAVTQNLVNYNGDFYIANRGGDTVNFDGLIDELRIYNRQLSDQEVWALQSQGAIEN